MRKFNHMKKLIGVMVVLVAMLANLMTPMVVEAAVSTAVADGSGTITITNVPSTSGISIKGKTFSLYKVLDSTSSGNYTVNTNFANFFAGTKTLGDGSGSIDLSATADYQKNVVDYINSYKNNMDAFTKLLRDYVNGVPVIDATAEQVNIPGENTEFTGLNYGYYFILDMTNPLQDGAVRVAAAINAFDGTENIDINVKGSAPTISKENKDNDTTNSDPWGSAWGYGVGDTVEYKLEAVIPVDITGYETYEYKIADVMDASITYDGNITLKIYTDSSLNTLLGTGYYSLGTTTNGPEITLDIIKIKNELDTVASILEKVYITYSGTINDNALQKFENNVTLTYSNDPYDTTTGTVTDTVYHNTFEIKVKKESDSKPGDGLADAVFGLFTATTPEKQLFLANSSGTNYHISTTGTANDTTGVITTDATGEFIIKGLDDGTEYILKEIAAPENHNKMDDIHFTINATYDKDTGAVTSITVNPNVGAIWTPVVNDNQISTTIINTTTSLLPSTGGIGTIVVRVAGVAVMIGAVGMFLYLRRKKETLAN